MRIIVRLENFTQTFFLKLLGFWVFWTNQCYFREKLILRNLVVFFLGNLEIVSLSNKNLLVIFIFNHWVKSVCIWSFSGPYFPYFPFIQPESGKIWTRGLQTYTFYFKLFWSKIDLLRVLIMEEAFRYIHRSVYDFMLLHNKFLLKAPLSWAEYVYKIMVQIVNLLSSS